MHTISNHVVLATEFPRKFCRCNKLLWHWHRRRSTFQIHSLREQVSTGVVGTWGGCFLGYLVVYHKKKNPTCIHTHTALPPHLSVVNTWLGAVLSSFAERLLAACYINVPKTPPSHTQQSKEGMTHCISSFVPVEKFPRPLLSHATLMRSSKNVICGWVCVCICVCTYVCVFNVLLAKQIHWLVYLHTLQGVQICAVSSLLCRFSSVVSCDSGEFCYVHGRGPK